MPCGAVLDSGELLANEHLRQRGMVRLFIVLALIQAVSLAARYV